MDNEIEVDLKDTTTQPTGTIQASVTDEVVKRLKIRFSGSIQGEIWQRSHLKSSSDYELLVITVKPGVNRSMLREEVRRFAQSIIAEIVVGGHR